VGFKVAKGANGLNKKQRGGEKKKMTGKLRGGGTQEGNVGGNRGLVYYGIPNKNRGGVKVEQGGTKE